MGVRNVKSKTRFHTFGCEFTHSHLSGGEHRRQNCWTSSKVTEVYFVGNFCTLKRVNREKLLAPLNNVLHICKLFLFIATRS